MLVIMLSNEGCMNHLGGRQFSATLRAKLDPSMYPLERMGRFLLLQFGITAAVLIQMRQIPDFRQRVELPHEARVEVHR